MKDTMNAGEMPELFSVGDLVTWTPPGSGTMGVSDGRSGPFKIHSVTLIPPGQCNCGGYADDRDHEPYGGCPYRHLDPSYGRLVRDTVGHWQWVQVEDCATGEVVPSPTDGTKPSTFSGAWFTHAA